MKTKNFWTEYKRWGFIDFLFLCLHGSVQRWLTICAINLREHCAKPRPTQLATNRQIRKVANSELIQLSKDPAYELTTSFLNDALKRGDICFAVYEDEKILAYTWRAFEPTPHVEGLWVGFMPGYRYGYKSFTHPDYRRQNLQQALGILTDPTMLTMGFRYAIGFVETTNLPSRYADKKRGAKTIGYAGYLTILGTVIPFRTPGAKKHGFRFYVPSNASGETKTPA